MDARRLGATGRDLTGAVSVDVDANGLAESIRVHPDWRRLVGVHGLAAAVTQAGLDAVEALRDIDDAAPRAWADERVDTGRAGVTESMAERIWQAFEASDRLMRRLRERADTGTSGLGRLTLTFEASDTLVCEADAEWVGQQDTTQLEVELASALASLRARRDETDAVWAHARTTAARLAPDPGPSPRPRKW